jgi:hypothetical protein
MKPGAVCRASAGPGGGQATLESRLQTVNRDKRVSRGQGIIVFSFSIRYLFKKPNIPEAEVTLRDGRKIHFTAFWDGFQPGDDEFWSRALDTHCPEGDLRVLGPFWSKRHRYYLKGLAQKKGLWDFYITGENKEYPRTLARKFIGFKVPKTEHDARFPYWMWHLPWFDNRDLSDAARYGEPLSIVSLGQSINDRFGVISETAFRETNLRAVLVASYMRDHRKMMYEHCAATLGCDLFGRGIREFEGPKKDLIKTYYINLCPENSVGEGYITEKVPEAFQAGCIPITYCHPDDLARDFNPNAVVNMYGLSAREMRDQFLRLKTDYAYFNALRSEPLLQDIPTLEGLISVLKS